MFRAIVFFGLITLAFAGATLDALVNAAAKFSIAMKQQLEVLASSPSPTEFAGKTIAYAEAKTAYFAAMRSAIPELINIATGREARPPELDNLAEAFSLAGEKQEHLAEAQTLILLKQFLPNPDVEKAREEFESAQKVQESFHKDFDGQDFTRRYLHRWQVSVGVHPEETVK
jgi:hypothetical protein